MSRSKATIGLSLVLGICFSLAATEGAHAGPVAGEVEMMPSRDKLVYRQTLYDNGSRVGEIRFYSNIGGRGGNFQIQNLTGQNRKFSIAIENNKGKTDKRIVHAKASAKSPKQSCFSAGTRNAGIRKVHLRYSKVE